jgi:hypothetical protein
MRYSYVSAEFMGVKALAPAMYHVKSVEIIGAWRVDTSGHAPMRVRRRIHLYGCMHA